MSALTEIVCYYSSKPLSLEQFGYVLRSFLQAQKIAVQSGDSRAGGTRAGGGTRTRTELSLQRILSPLRMPFRHPGLVGQNR